ncbi:hypothetical protein Landi51_05873 [Colletotrichum acutatum]
MPANGWSIALRRSKGSGDGTGAANVAICWSGEIKRIGTHIRASVRIGRLPEPVTPHIWECKPSREPVLQALQRGATLDDSTFRRRWTLENDVAAPRCSSCFKLGMVEGGCAKCQACRPSQVFPARPAVMADADANLFLLSGYHPVDCPPSSFSTNFQKSRLTADGVYLMPLIVPLFGVASFGSTIVFVSSGSPKTNSAGVCADAKSSTGCKEGQLDRTSWADFPWPNFSPSPAIR